MLASLVKTDEVGVIDVDVNHETKPYTPVLTVPSFELTKSPK
jgi:hypothetical protein